MIILKLGRKPKSKAIPKPNTRCFSCNAKADKIYKIGWQLLRLCKKHRPGGVKEEV